MSPCVYSPILSLVPQVLHSYSGSQLIQTHTISGFLLWHLVMANPSTPHSHPDDRQVVAHSWVSAWTQRKSYENCELQCKCRYCCCSWLCCPSLAGLRCSYEEKNKLWRNRPESLNVVEATDLSGSLADRPLGGKWYYSSPKYVSM